MIIWKTKETPVMRVLVKAIRPFAVGDGLALPGEVVEVCGRESDALFENYLAVDATQRDVKDAKNIVIAPPSLVSMASER